MGDVDLEGKVCLITGGNAGIGRAAAEALAKRHATVVILCRDATRGEQARKEVATASGNPKVELLVADLSSLKSVRAAADEFRKRHTRLHILVNNAGVFLSKREVTEDGLEKTFVTNYLSHFLLTNLLLDLLKASAPSRIVNVSSKTGGTKMDWDDLQTEKGYSFLKAVPKTKLGQLMLTRELAARLAGTGVTVTAVHPGLVKTPLLDDISWFMRTMIHLFSMKPEKAGQLVAWAATDPGINDATGRFYDEKRREMPLPDAANEAESKRMWDVSTKLAKLEA